MANHPRINPVFNAVPGAATLIELYDYAEKLRTPITVIGAFCAVSAVACLVGIAASPILATLGTVFFTLLAVACKDSNSIGNNYQKLMESNLVEIQAVANSVRTCMDYLFTSTWLLRIFKEKIIASLEHDWPQF